MVQRSAPALRVAVQRDGDAAVLRLAGELDIATEARLRARLRDLLEPERERPVRRLVVDAAGLRFLDVVGLRVLADAHEALRGRGGELVLRAPSRQVRRVLQLLRSRLPVEP